MHANKLIQDFISRFQARKWDSMSAILPIAQFGSDGIIGFIEAVIQEIPNCHTYTDAALSFLPLEDWPQVVRIAVNALLQDKMNQAAQSVIRTQRIGTYIIVHVKGCWRRAYLMS